MSATSARLPAVVVDRAGVQQLDSLRPLWDAMQEHHASVAPRVAKLSPLRTNADSWTRRRASYERWLEQPEAFLLLASDGDTSVGYLFGHVISGWTSLDTGPRVGEIESLSVLPDQRGRGIGHLLIQRAHREFAALDIDTVALSVFAENADAIRLYEAHGMTPTTITYLGRVSQAVPTPSPPSPTRTASTG